MNYSIIDFRGGPPPPVDDRFRDGPPPSFDPRDRPPMDRMPADPRGPPSDGRNIPPPGMVDHRDPRMRMEDSRGPPRDERGPPRGRLISISNLFRTRFVLCSAYCHCFLEDFKSFV